MSDNENRVFLLRVSPHNYEMQKFKHQTFKNSLGTWHVCITYVAEKGEDYAVLNGSVYLEDPKDSLSLSDMRISLRFVSLINKTHGTILAEFDPESSQFYFSGFIFHLPPNCKVDVEIEAFPKLISVHDAKPTSKTIEYSKEIFESGKLADVIIKTKDENEIAAHNFFLSRSDVFDTMLNIDMKEAKEKVIQILDIDHDVLIEMVRYLYCDEVPMIQEMAIDLLVAADKYNIRGLVDECVKFLLDNVTMENHGRILAISDQLGIKSLKEAAIEFVVENRKEIFATESWKELKKNNVQLALEIMEKNMSISYFWHNSL